MLKKISLLVFISTVTVLVSCKKEEETKTTNNTISPEFKNRSKTPSFIKMGSDFSGVGIYTLVSSEDSIPNSNNMVYGGAPDGQGFIKNPDGSGFKIMKIELMLKGKVQGIDKEKFLELANNAKNGCPVSKALASVAISLTAELL